MDLSLWHRCGQHFSGHMMIIKAGFDWIMSGGNQEAISGAHKKIGNALMGFVFGGDGLFYFKFNQSVFGEFPFAECLDDK